MLRASVLTVVGLGILVSCGSPETDAEEPGDTLRQIQAVEAPGPLAQAVLEVTPDPVDAGEQRVGTTGVYNVELKNGAIDDEKDQTLFIEDISIAGENAAAFSWDAGWKDEGWPDLVPTDSENIIVTFSPTDGGLHSSTLVIKWKSGGNGKPDRIVNLSGTGVQPLLGLAPTSVEFLEQVVGTEELRNVEVSNIGTGTLHFATISIDGGEGTFTSDAGTLPNLGPDAGTVLRVRFLPVDGGTVTANLSITSPDLDSPANIPLSGTGVRPVLSLNPNVELDFQEQRVGKDATRYVAVSNTGTGALHFSGISIDGGGGAFSVSQNTLPPMRSDAGTTALEVTFNPPDAGTYEGSLSFATNDPDSPRILPLYGVGVQPILELTPADAGGFGRLRVGADAGQSILLRNVGTADLNLGAITIDGGSGAYSYTAPTPSTLGPDAGTTLVVTYIPRSTGEHNATLYIPSDAPGSPASVPLSGVGVQPFLEYASPVDAGEQRVNIGATVQVALRNSGTDTLHFGTLSVDGGNGAFVLAPYTPPDLPPDGGTVVNVEFMPTTDGVATAVLSVPSDAPESLANIVLSGRGVQSVLVLDPPQTLDFGSRAVGSDTQLRISVANASSATASLNVTAIAITDGAPFTISDSTPFSLAPGYSLERWVKFRPPNEGDHTASLFVTHDAAGPPSTTIVTLRGHGGRPRLTVAPPALNFGPQRVGTIAEKQVTISNESTATAPLEVTTIDLIGSVASYEVSPTTPFTLDAGTSQTLKVVFQPRTPGAHDAGISLAHNAIGSPFIVELSGHGSAPHATFSPSPLVFHVDLGDSSQTLPVTLTNSGDAPLAVDSVSITPLPSFQVSGLSGGWFSLPPGESIYFQVTFSPASTVGTTDGRLSLIGSDGDYYNGGALDLTGMTHGARLNVSPSALSFAPTPPPNFAVRSISLSNTGDRAVDMDVQSSNPTIFDVSGGQYVTIPPDGGVVLDVTFRPATCQNYIGVLELNLTGAVEGPSQVDMTGTGKCAFLSYSFPPDGGANSLLDFGYVRLDVPKQRLVRVENPGTELLSFTGYTPPQSPFSTEPMLPVSSLAPGGMTEFYVSFLPREAGAVTSGLRIGSNAINAVDGGTLISLSGIGAMPHLLLDRSNLSFGDVRVGDSKPIEVTITNTGNAELSIHGVSVTGPFAVTNLNASTRIQGNAVHKFTVEFSPTVKGSACPIVDGGGTCSIVIQSDSEPDTAVLPVSGNGTVSHIEVSESSRSLDFGNVRVQDTSGTRPVVISNSGGADLGISNFMFSGGMFNFSPMPDAGTLWVGGGQQVALPVVFSPSVLGNVVSDLYVISNAENFPDPIVLRGTGVDGLPMTDPTVVSFAGVPVGAGGEQRQAVLSNVGGHPLVLGTDGGQPLEHSFTVAGLVDGLLLRPDAGWPFSVTFAPTRRGFITGSLPIGSDSRTVPVFHLSMAGTGFAPVVDLVPTTVNFGKSNIGASVTKDFSIRNLGEGDLYVPNINIVDHPEGAPGAAQDFALEGVVFPIVVEQAKAKTIQLKFTPRLGLGGVRKAQAIVYSNDPAPNRGALEVELLGEGTSPGLKTVPSSLDFGRVMVGRPSEPRSFKLTNTGSGPLFVSAISLAGANASSFSMTPPELSTTLHPNASAEVSVTVTPPDEGGLSAHVVVQSDDQAASSILVPLAAEGVLQQLQISPATLDFGLQLINNTSNQHSFAVSNNTGAGITLTGLAMEGCESQYTVEALALPHELAAGAEKEVKVAFTPKGEAVVICVLKISASNQPQPLSVTLTGRGVYKVFSVDPSPLDFGTMRAGGAIRELPLTITNLSSDPIVLAKPTIVSSSGAPFSFDWVNLEDEEIVYGRPLIVKVRYQSWQETASETIVSFGTTTPPQPGAVQLQIKGGAQARFLSVDRELLDFGFRNVNTTAEPEVVTVTNASSDSQQVEVKLVGGGDEGDSPFKLGVENLALPIPPGATASFTVTFAPTTVGLVESEVEVRILGESAAEVVVPVKGQGRNITGQGGGCSCNSAGAGSAGLLVLLALAGLRARRRRHE